MDAAIWQFRSFENASLHYADADGVAELHGKVGLWDTTIDADELGEVLDQQVATPS